MAEEDVDGGVASPGDQGDGGEADEWVGDLADDPGPLTEEEQASLANDLHSVRHDLRPEIVDTPLDEQAVRDRFGYAASESHTQAERQRVAEYLTDEFVREHTYQGDLPLDILGVWGENERDELTARSLIATWGLDGFRGSALHQAALGEQQREQEKALVRKAFLAAQKRKSQA